MAERSGSGIRRPEAPAIPCLATLTGRPGGVRWLAVAPDGSWLASGGYGGEIQIWDPVTGTPHHTLAGDPAGVRWLVVAPDGSWLASASYGGDLRIWNPVTGTAH